MTSGEETCLGKFPCLHFTLLCRVCNHLDLLNFVFIETQRSPCSERTENDANVKHTLIDFCRQQNVLEFPMHSNTCGGFDEA